jgi:hypothetical protein
VGQELEARNRTAMPAFGRQSSALSWPLCGSDPPSRKRSAPTHALAPLPSAGRGGPAGATAVAFRAGDGVGLRGRLFGRGTAAVVLAHTGNAVSNEADWYPLARRLAREGYLVLTYDRRAVCSGEKAHDDCSAGANVWGTAGRTSSAR